jgi:SAM-dependent methyltransferase/uncharacterized protein YbaR (Trm112 family)
MTDKAELHSAMKDPLASWPHLAAILRCPYCGGGFSVEKVSAVDSNYGLLRCDCHQYPVVEGIPVLQQTEGLDGVATEISQERPQAALLQTLSAFRIRWAQQSRIHQARYVLNCRRLVYSPDVSFAQAAQWVRRPKVFADYLTHRFANPSLLSAIAPMLALRDLHPGDQAHVRVIDLGCGAGHASFLLKHLYPEYSVFSADQDFISLYLARRFVATESIYVCWDGEAPNPFPDGFFDAVFCMDAFHYMKSKRAVIAECRRTARDEALYLFPHLHNSLQHNYVAGVPLSPAGYKRVLDLPNGRFFDEFSLLSLMRSNGSFAPHQSQSKDQLDSAQTLTFFAGPPQVFRNYNGFPAILQKRAGSLALNPIYQQKATGDQVDLTFRWPNETIKNECSRVQQILPDHLRVSRADIEHVRNGGSLSRAQQELIDKFILVPLPANYASCG